MIDLRVTGGEISKEEKDFYIQEAMKKFPQRTIERIDVALDGEYADLHYFFKPVGFERIRRITGYLVGTMDRWNDAKRQEENDRVKHPVL